MNFSMDSLFLGLTSPLVQIVEQTFKLQEKVKTPLYVGSNDNELRHF